MSAESKLDDSKTGFVLEFEIDGLPKLQNQLLRGHWATRHGHAKTWKRKVSRECWHRKPSEPLKKAKLVLTRHSSSEPDFDGLASSFKHVIDGLVEVGILENDKPSNIAVEYVWIKTKRGEGFVSIRVEEIATPIEKRGQTDQSPSTHTQHQKRREVCQE